jgi:hypothetical protein
VVGGGYGAPANGACRDPTGRPGPSTWELGTYPAGADDLPVGGVSWYEAAAYCAAVGKTLPTAHHFFRANQLAQFSDVLQLANFESKGPVAVGATDAIGTFGTYDMAGNVREWCANETEGRRFLLGGSWDDPSYVFRNLDSQPPSDRAPHDGFRCARYLDPPPPEALAPIAPPLPVAQPASDEVFEALRGTYAYPRTDLAATTAAVEDPSAYWTHEKASFNGTNGERMIAHLLIPRGATPPYQAVVWYPGGDAYLTGPGSAFASAFMFDFIPRSGRVLVYPVFKGMYERRAPRETERAGRTALELRDQIVTSAKDLFRTLDYLETRPDIDGARFAYYGFSTGGAFGPVFTAVDPRFKASILLAGGVNRKAFVPEIMTVNFAPRVRTPTLMINGRDDFIFPLQTSQRLLFDLLGPRPPDKRHALLAGGHIPPRVEVIKEVLDWLDHYLGPVATVSPTPRDAP